MPEFVVLAQLHQLVKDARWLAEEPLCAAIDRFIEEFNRVMDMRTGNAHH